MTYRLMEMGLIEGARVEVLGRAPLGDPLHIRLGDYELSLRCEEAELIDIACY
jgi:Fe2+ transport system protein FeoA